MLTLRGAIKDYFVITKLRYFPVLVFFRYFRQQSQSFILQTYDNLLVVNFDIRTIEKYFIEC